MRPFDQESLELDNIKDDIILVQFKLVKKDTLKIVNTISFVNLPLSKMQDTNMMTIFEIVGKQNTSAHQAKQGKSKKE